MDTFVWLLAGALVGWVTYSLLGYNRRRGFATVLAIGALGALFGGKLLAPIVLDDSIVSDFSGSALFFVAAVSAVFLLVSNALQKRRGA